MNARALTILGLALWLVAAGLRLPSADRHEGRDALPPTVAVARIALGGLSPLLVDLLWVRAAEQQEARQYFAMAQTARQIALLQPDSAGLFVFEARNLAFNVASEFRDPAARWSWIRRGLRLLAEDGLAAQPDEPAIDQAIATILLGSIGDRYDDQSVPLRLIWARAWQPLVAKGDDGRFSLAPDLNTALLRAWRMDPARVVAVDRLFGPLDWRTPEAHAIYWANEAVRKAGGEARRPVAARLRYQALWAAFQGGRMMLDPQTGALQLLPDGRLIVPLVREMERLQASLPEDHELPVARLNIERDAVLVLYLEGHPNAAADRLIQARQLPGGHLLPPDLDQAILEAAGWAADVPPQEQVDVLVDWLRTSARMRDVGAADLARGWERVARLAWQQERATLPSFGALVEQAVDAR